MWGDSSRAELVARTPRASSATTNNPQPQLPATCLCAVHALQYRATWVSGQGSAPVDCISDYPDEGVMTEGACINWLRNQYQHREQRPARPR